MDPLDIPVRAIELSNKVALPIGWSFRFCSGALDNGDAFTALGEDGLTHFANWSKQLVAERVVRPNATLGMPGSIGPGPDSLDTITLGQITPAVGVWVESNFYDWPLHISDVGFFESERRVRERDKVMNEERREDWRSEKLDFRNRLVDGVREQIVRLMAGSLGVPERLTDQFTDWLTERSSRSFQSLSSNISDWSEQPEYPEPPAVEPQGISHEQYEAYCCSMLQSWGYLDASTTRYVQDGGVDVESAELVVQCKHVKGNVGAPDIQKIFGIASKDGKTAVVFSAGGFTKEGLKWANQAGVALITLREIDGTASPQNETAKLVMARWTEKR
ncbi:restriction endonuclease [Pontimonas sp.]|nr:restriction endonuclease [Pontimonas sp.]MDA8901134.1 restriction endonuclease [Pontimonas sp.]